MSAQVDVLSEIFTVSMPVFVMVIVGMVLKRVRLIDDAFIGTSSTLTFKALMPALLFFGIMQADLHTALQPKLIGYFYLATLLTFAVSWLWSLKAVPAAQRGVYVQGAFRGNCGIVSLALATSLYGDYGLSIGGVMAGLVIILFNVLSVIVLAIYSTSYQADLRSVLRDMARNPLILMGVCTPPLLSNRAMLSIRPSALILSISTLGRTIRITYPRKAAQRSASVRVGLSAKNTG